jgi:NRAMP (natural resistance-associated macrophage protein)-like metal ion transporter
VFFLPLEHNGGVKKKVSRLSKFFKVFGPGLITGAADDDPSGIATYSQTGAQFGFGQLWTAVFMLPFQVAVQEACARIGAVTGHGLSYAVKKHYTKRVLMFMVILILVANTINIGADIGAMASALQLVTPFPFAPLTIVITVGILLLEIFTSYKSYAKVLKCLALSLLAYPLTLIIIHAPWATIIPATFIPHIEFNFAFFFIITGVLGTTISPYMFFWQASEEVEEERSKNMIRHGIVHLTARFMRALRLDNFLGMLFSELGTWSIIIVTATVLNSHGVTDIKTAADAARALEPLVASFPNAGYLAKLLFTTGILGLGLLSIPVLAGSAAYALAEAFNFRDGLNLKLKQAHGFYGAITIATLVGLLINYVGIDPIKALVYTAVINDFVAVPLIFLIAKISGNKKIMGKYQSGIFSRVFTWATFVGMGAAAIGTVVMLIK